MPMPRKLAISRKFEKKPMYRTSEGTQRISSSSTKSSVPLVRTRRVRFPRSRSITPAPETAPGRGPVDIGATVSGLGTCYGPAAEGRFSAAGPEANGEAKVLAVRGLVVGRLDLVLFLELVLDVVAGTGARARANGATDDRARRAGDRTTDDRP